MSGYVTSVDRTAPSSTARRSVAAHPVTAAGHRWPVPAAASGITANAPPPAPAHCAHCGGRLPVALGGRDGDTVCAGCRAQPLPLVHGLLSRAADEDGLAELRGYEVVRELHRGSPGSGVVYLARHRGTGAPAALRMLLAEVAVGRRARADFLREAGYVRGLRHKNILSRHGSGAHGAAFCLICEYCPGGTLRQLLDARGGTLPPDEAVAIAVQVLDALAHAHGSGRPASLNAPHQAALLPPEGLVHGAVRPSNILLTGAGTGDGSAKAARPGGIPPTVKITGFGLAKAFDRAGLSGLTRSGSLASTVAYLPRTQLTGPAHAGPEDDVWATAATLYRMLTGTTPRDFPPTVDPLAVLLKEPAVPVRRRGPVPRRLAQVLDAALIDSPRIVTTRADELRTALLEAVR